MGDEFVALSIGETCDRLKKVLEIRNASLSDFSIPASSIVEVKGSDELGASVLYFVDDRHFYLGLLGFSGSLNLYFIDLNKGVCSDLYIRTIADSFYFNSSESEFTTLSALKEQNDSTYHVTLNYYSIESRKRLKSEILSFSMSDYESILSYNPYTISK
ncbi:hypothetical protein [Croceimicrobium sp.]|uniref:hypothetical protein n=1 Tax=Croceimicrobium sp. TaxID=2828340 RepID=UPI003BAB3052